MFGLALALVWGAYLDPMETLTGLAGPVTHEVIAARGPGANVVLVMALITAAMSAAWGWWDRAGAVGASWLALLIAMLAAYVILTPGTRTTSPPTTADTSLQRERVALEGPAFGAAPESWTPPVSPPLAAAAAIPLWDPNRIRVRVLGDSMIGTGVAVPGVRFDPSGRWLLALSPDGTGLLRVVPPPSWENVHRGVWARAPGPLWARESDSGLALTRAATGPRVTWFGAGFLDYAVVDPGTIAGVPLTGGWRRLALAWALQAPELTRGALKGRTLLWRRDAGERFTALAPFAQFEAPVPALVGDSLWWVSWGSVEAETFPLVDTVMIGKRILRYRRPGLVAALNAVSGTTRFWLSPQTDSLTAAWARIVAPLVGPADSIPPGLRDDLPYPAEAFAIQSRIVLHTLGGDSAFHWFPAATEPFTLAARGPGDTARSIWLAQAFVDSATHHVLGGILAGLMTRAGPRLYLWNPTPVPVPAALWGDRDRSAGVRRIWPTEAGVLTVQARFWQPQDGPQTARLDSAFVSLNTDTAGDVSTQAALRALLRGPDLADGTPAASLRRARALVARMDSALAAGRVARFGVLYDSLRALLRGASRTVAPPTGPR